MRSTEFPHARGQTIARTERTKAMLNGEIENTCFFVIVFLRRSELKWERKSGEKGHRRTVPYGSRVMSAREPGSRLVGQVKKEKSWDFGWTDHRLLKGYLPA